MSLEEVWIRMGGEIKQGALVYQGILCAQRGRSLSGGDLHENELPALMKAAGEIAASYSKVLEWWKGQGPSHIAQDDGDGETSFWIDDKFIVTWWLYGAMGNAAIWEQGAWSPCTPQELQDRLSGKRDLIARRQTALNTLRACQEAYDKAVLELANAKQEMDDALAQLDNFQEPNI